MGEVLGLGLMGGSDRLCWLVDSRVFIKKMINFVTPLQAIKSSNGGGLMFLHVFFFETKKKLNKKKQLAGSVGSLIRNTILNVKINLISIDTTLENRIIILF